LSRKKKAAPEGAALIFIARGEGSAPGHRALTPGEAVERASAATAAAASAAIVVRAGAFSAATAARTAIVMASPTATAPASATFAVAALVVLLLAVVGAEFLPAAFALIGGFGVFTLEIAFVLVRPALGIHDLHGIGILAALGLPLRGPALRLLAEIALAFAARLALPEAAFLLLQQAFARHGRRHHTVIVLRVLEVILVLHAVAARLRVAGVLHVLLVNLGSCAADLYVRAVAFVWAIAVISTTAAAGLAPAPPLTLHVTILIFRIRPNWTGLGSLLF
jgi:hypothetical protein